MTEAGVLMGATEAERTALASDDPVLRRAMEYLFAPELDLNPDEVAIITYNPEALWEGVRDHYVLTEEQMCLAAEQCKAKILKERDERLVDAFDRANKTDPGPDRLAAEEEFRRLVTIRFPGRDYLDVYAEFFRHRSGLLRDGEARLL